MRITTEKGFSGIDERITAAGGISTARTENFIIEPSGALSKRAEITAVCGYEAILPPTPGVDTEQTIPEYNVDGLWAGILGGTETVVITVRGRLLAITPDVGVTVHLPFSQGKCLMFEFDGELYLKTSERYAKFNGSKIVDVEPYIPCVAIGCSADGSGEPFEQINLICDLRRQIFSADGVSNRYRLSETEISEITAVTLCGEAITGGFSLENGCEAVFDTPPAEGVANLEITYRRAMSESDRQRIFGCTQAMTFGGNSDGRVFLWGNPEHPNVRFHSELADGIPSAAYFPVNAFTQIGNSRINCIIQQYDRQLIFTKDEAYYSKCELREDALGNVYSSFPVFSLNGGKGCLIETPGCVIDNRPVTLCYDGLNIWESTSVENEKNAVCISGPIEKSIREILSGDLGRLHTVDFQAERRLYFLADGRAYVFDYGEGKWFILNGFEGTRFTAFGDSLYLCKGGSLYRYRPHGADTDCEAVYESATVSPKRDGSVSLTRLDADIFTAGDVKIKIEITSSSGESAVREFDLSAERAGYKRICFRPSLRRVNAFKIRLTASGSGEAVIHGMVISAKENERRNRHGIL